MAIWRVLIIPSGVRARLCIGKDPEAIGKRLQELDAQKEKIIHRIIIHHVFEKPLSKDAIEHLLMGNYDQVFSTDQLNDEFEQKKIKVVKDMGGGYALGAIGYEAVVNSCKPDCLEVQAELDADSPSEFSENYGDSPEGALKVLDSVTRIYGAVKDPIKTIMKWRKILEANKEED